MTATSQATFGDDSSGGGKTTQGGQKLDDTFGDGVGRPSENDPVLKSRQPVKVPTSFKRGRE